MGLKPPLKILGNPVFDTCWQYRIAHTLLTVSSHGLFSLCPLNVSSQRLRLQGKTIANSSAMRKTNNVA
jgi:hypothetical protein